MTMKISNKLRAVRNPSLSLKEMVEAAAQRSAEAREKKAAKEKLTGKISLPVLTREWVLRNRQAGNTVAPVKLDVVILQKHLSKLTAQGVDPRAYLVWVIQNWSVVMREKFGWMKGDVPRIPAIRFLVKFAPEWLEAWQMRDRLAKLAGMTTKERLAQSKIEAGMTPETAMREIEGGREGKGTRGGTAGRVARRARPLVERERGQSGIAKTTGGTWGDWKD